MKKVVLVVLCVVLLFSAVSCGKLTGAVSEAKVQAIVEMAQSGIEAEAEAYEDTLGITIKARDTAIVYTFQYKVDIEDTDTLKASLEQGTESSKSVYENIVTEMKNESISNPSVVIEYKDKSGNMLYTREFK